MSDNHKVIRGFLESHAVSKTPQEFIICGNPGGRIRLGDLKALIDALDSQESLPRPRIAADEASPGRRSPRS